MWTTWRYSDVFVLGMLASALMLGVSSLWWIYWTGCLQSLLDWVSPVSDGSTGLGVSSLWWIHWSCSSPQLPWSASYQLETWKSVTSTIHLLWIRDLLVFQETFCPS